MYIYPAIDLRKGKCIRLYQGDYQQETIYSLEPINIAKQFVAQGANWLHVIDLDAAQDPQQKQSLILNHLIKESGAQVQTGGGIRTRDQVASLLEQGATRIIIGSLAIDAPKEVYAWFNYFGAERICLALDISFTPDKQPMVAHQAWKEISSYSLFDLIDFFKTAGLQHVLCTNIALDGTLNGPDYDLYTLILTKYPFLKLQASGGIQALHDIKKLETLGLDGVIIGRALYENKFTLAQALSC